MHITAQVLPPDYTSIIVSQASNNMQPQNPPDVILQTLPDVVTSFLESPPASNDGCGGNEVACSPVPKVIETAPEHPVTKAEPNTETSNFLLAATDKIVKTEPTIVNGELSNLGDLDSLLLGIANVAGDKAMPSSGTDLCMDTFEAEKLDCTWESGSSSSSGSHFEFPCTQDMLGDIGVNEPVDYWGSVDDIMIRI